MTEPIDCSVGWYVFYLLPIGQAVLGGIIAGVAAGLVLRRFDDLQKMRDRASQIAHLRAHIEVNFRSIMRADKVPDHAVNEFRFDMFGNLLRGLQAVANRGTSALNDVEASLLQMTLARQLYMRGLWQGQMAAKPDESWYRRCYKELRTLEWLKLAEAPWE